MSTELIETANARQCLASSKAKILEVWPLNDRNEWAAGSPPPEVVEALGLIDSAIGHLDNLHEFGPVGYEVSPRPATPTRSEG